MVPCFSVHSAYIAYIYIFLFHLYFIYNNYYLLYLHFACTYIAYLHLAYIQVVYPLIAFWLPSTAYLRKIFLNKNLALKI